MFKKRRGKKNQLVLLTPSFFNLSKKCIYFHPQLNIGTLIAISVTYVVGNNKCNTCAILLRASVFEITSLCLTHQRLI